jgi:hypothetical protein
MPELKKIRVREAKPRDKGLFKMLWQKFMEEQHKKGDLALPSEHNLGFYAELFDLYVSGEVDGVVLFVADQAVTMCGDPLSYLELRYGRQAYWWGMYVEPENRKLGISNAFHGKMQELLQEKGFDFGATTHVEGDEVAVKNSDGAEREIEIVSTNVIWRFKE